MKKQLFNKLRWLFLCVGILCLVQTGWSQDRQVTGKVTESDKSALPGANVSVKGTTRGTTTNAEGVYKITVKEGATLVFSSLGFEKQEVKVGNQSVIDVKLISANSELEEVTVTTAFGLDKNKRGLGYAVQTVSGDDIAETGRENMLTALQGRVAGATINTTSGAPGASSAIVLRGFNSLSGNNSPLIVIDGLPINNSTLSQGALASGSSNRDNDYSNRLSDLNPNDIESVTVLKGPEATSLYGIDAGSGAIIIKTKKGQAGKPKFSYNNAFRVDQMYLFPEQTQTVYGVGDFGNTSRTNRFFGPRISDTTAVFNNVENFFQDATSQIHNLSVNGGKGNFTYRASLGSTNQKGNVTNTSYDRYNGRVTLDYSAFKNRLNISGTAAYAYANNKKALRGAGGYLQALLYWPVIDDASKYLKGNGERRRFFDDLGLAEIDNPYWSVNKNTSEDDNYRQNYNLSTTIRPKEWLTLIAKLSYDGYTTDGNSFIHPESNVNYSTGGNIEEYNTKYRGLSGVFIAGVNKKIGSKIEMDFKVGTAIDDYRTEIFSRRGQRLAKQAVTRLTLLPTLIVVPWEGIHLL
jgi:TonB-linked SusC/RagA family outer membrane protein